MATKTSARKGSKKAVKASKKTAKSRTARKKTARKKTAARAAASRPTRRKATAQKSRRTIRGTIAAAVQAVTGAFPWAADENDPIALLESDHRRFENLLKQGEDTTARAVKGRAALLETLTAALNVHELIEERILYPALKPHTETRDIVLEGFEEHHVADLIVKELHDLAKDNEQWGAKFKVLKESLEHHIQEEEGEMFPTARQVLTPEELQVLGARMRNMKAEAERRG